METKIDFTSEGIQQKIRILGEELFEKITELPEAVRPRPKKPRTGIRVYLGESGMNARNFCVVGVKYPSEATLKFIFEKAIRSYTLGYPTSGTKADPKLLQYAGSISYDYGSGIIQCSASGLSAEEDVTCAIIIMHIVGCVSMKEIFEYIAEKKGELPAEYNEPDHYLSKLLKKYDLDL